MGQTLAAKAVDLETARQMPELAPRRGFEPRLTAPKAAVLPLHQQGIETAERETALNLRCAFNIVGLRPTTSPTYEGVG